jgi:hypothetical protein
MMVKAQKEVKMQDINMLSFLLIGLASFRLTRLVVYDKITEFLRDPFLREQTEIDESGQEITYLIPREKGLRRFIGELISCHWCTGIWISTFLVSFYLLFPKVAYILILILSIAAVGSIIETFIQKQIE